MAGVTFRRDATWRRLDPTTVLAGSPLTLFRVTAAGAAVLDALEVGSDLPAGHRPLTERMVAAGAIHPCPDPATSLADVTVVVPTHGEPAATIAALVQHLGPVRHVVVVDDAAPVPLRPLDGAEVLRLPANAGPAGARNAALERVETPFVLFVDADARIAPGAVETLLGHLADERVAAVAPRVRPPTPATDRSETSGAAAEPAPVRAIDRYEAVRSPLDMGAEPALVRPGTRVGYVPTAVLLCRTAALREVGGFDPALRYGEDVDLVWRLVDAGWSCRYEPVAAAGHAVRPSLRSWLRQRSSYGGAAAPLDRRHPGALAPARVSRWSAAAWAAGAAGHLVVASATAAAGTVRLARPLTDAAVAPATSLRIAGTSVLQGGLQLADATISVWWPAAAGGALLSRRLRWLLAGAAIVPGLIEWRQRRPRLDPLRYVALRTLDRASYGVGLWRGVLAERRPGPLLPRLD